MKYTLIMDGEKVASSNNFDSLIDIADRNCGGFVVETKDWDAQQRAIEANTVHMQKGGIKLTGNNLAKIRTSQMELSNAEFDYLMRKTFLTNGGGSDIDEFSSQVNIAELSRIANSEQRELLGKHLRGENAS